ncbi:MAG: hypothetical protein PUG43_02475 [Clostridiales bacterium]|nr:hypothetical protein [Clostridiales bacterium]
MLRNRLTEFEVNIVDSKNEIDINLPDDEALLKSYVRSSLKKIIASRSGEIEIVEIL